jgi:NADPH-dependent ferric siderophore reductase
MLTYAPEHEIEREDRASYRPYAATVVRIRQLTPHFVRVTFTGPDFATFGTDGLDQRVKLVLPIDGFGLYDFGDDADWYTTWRALPAEQRNPFRTYTVRAIRPRERELDVDFVAHGDGGPAAQWLNAARVGDVVTIVGPDARSIHSSQGIDWRPGTATHVLLVGDETAAPAISSILESLDPAVTAHAFIEVPSVDDFQQLDTHASVTWLARGEQSGLEAAVRSWAAADPAFFASAVAASAQVVEEIDVDREMLWDSPEAATGEFYAWLAGESAIIKTLRRFLVSETGIDRKRVAFMGYWRLGKAEAQE